jgi:LysM repeat protein
MAGRSPARFIAPLALVVSALALYLVVQSTTRDDTETPATPSATSSTNKSSSKAKRNAKKRHRRRTYTVKAGDTPSGIAEKTGVTLEQILELNPDLDPQSLSPGTKIKLRR